MLNQSLSIEGTYFFFLWPIKRIPNQRDGSSLKAAEMFALANSSDPWTGEGEGDGDAKQSSAVFASLAKCSVKIAHPYFGTFYPNGSLQKATHGSN